MAKKQRHKRNEGERNAPERGDGTASSSGASKEKGNGRREENSLLE
jgi:hypothetical protein